MPGRSDSKDRQPSPSPAQMSGNLIIQKMLEQELEEESLDNPRRKEEFL